MLCRGIAGFAPRTLTGFVRQHDRRQIRRGWRNALAGKKQTAIRDGVLGFCSSPSVILLISCQCHLRRQRWKKKWYFSIVALSWESHTRKNPHNTLALPHPGYQLHSSCVFNNDLLERQWRKESICDTRRGRGKIQREVVGEKWGQRKQVSAGNERKGAGRTESKRLRTEK